jgi:Fibronectin type III domain
VTDYTHATGSSGTMMIRDTGSTIEFWINSNNTDTFNHDLPWAYIVNGVSSSWLAFNYNAGAGWQRLGSWTVTTNQTVTFKLNATGTSGFGGPTTFSHTVVRATVPGQPAKPTLSGVSLTKITVSWTPPSNGGSTITGYILGYGTSSSGPTTEITTTTPHVVTNLNMNTVYYFWVKARNAIGLGPYSPSASAKTYLGVYVNVGGIWKPAIPYVNVAGVWKQAQPNPVYTFHPL